MLRRLFSALLMLFVACASPSYASRKEMPVSDMMDSTVHLQVTVEEVYITDKEEKVKGKKKPTIKKVEENHSQKSGGTGFVLSKTDGKGSPVHSRVMTAAHVVDAPKVGSSRKEAITFFGIQIGEIEVRVDSVKIEAITADERYCTAKVLDPGTITPFTRDVAILDVDCDAGRAVELASEVPARGEKVFVVGHPLDVNNIIVTEGYVSGWNKEGLLNGMLTIAAPIVGGNSGGPIFYKGKVVGMATMVYSNYHHITLSVPLKNMLESAQKLP